MFAAQGWLRDLRVWGACRAAGVFQSGVQSQMSAFFADDAARAVWVPVLVAVGQRDPYLNPLVAQALANQVARARVELLDAGHYVQRATNSAGRKALLEEM